MNNGQSIQKLPVRVTNLLEVLAGIVLRMKTVEAKQCEAEAPKRE